MIPSVHIQVFSFSTIWERQPVFGILILWCYESYIGVPITHSTTMNKRREIALKKFAGTKDNMQREKISGVSICLGLVSFHPHKACVRPRTQVSNNDTSPSTLLEHGKVPGILLLISLTQNSFHQDFSEVYKHFHKELVTSLLTLPAYIGLTGCTGGMGIHQQTLTFLYCRSLTAFPSRFSRNVERCITKGIVYSINCGFYSSSVAGQTQELVQKNRSGYRCWSSNCGKPATNIAPSHISHTHTAAVAE